MIPKPLFSPVAIDAGVTDFAEGATLLNKSSTRPSTPQPGTQRYRAVLKSGITFIADTRKGTDGAQRPVETTGRCPRGFGTRAEPP